MTTENLLADYTSALKLASFDAQMGDSRWLSELVALAPIRAKAHPKFAKGFLAAARRAASPMRKAA